MFEAPESLWWLYSSAPKYLCHLWKCVLEAKLGVFETVFLKTEVYFSLNSPTGVIPCIEVAKN